MADENRYAKIITKIFESKFRKGLTEVGFERADIERVAKQLRVQLPKNLGDLIYSFRHRADLPESITRHETGGKKWVIKSTGRSNYAFVLTAAAKFTPSESHAETKVPDSTPGLISMYAKSDEQALLAKLRYNRLLDIFAGVACYSLQSHLRTTVRGLGQVETDELYVGVDRRGAHFVFPVQAKGGRDKIGSVQIEQDIAMCREKFADLVCRSVAAQFVDDDLIALLEFEPSSEGVRMVREMHYRLVPPDQLTEADLRAYRLRAHDSA